MPQAEIDLSPVDDDPFFNDAKDEYIIGVAPVDVRFKSELLFSDLKLSNDDILRDFGGNGEIDYTNQASFQHTFADSKLHTISYQLPKLPGTAQITGTNTIAHKDIWFSFDLRAIESELAKCRIDKENTRDNRWKFTPRFDENIQV